MTRKAVKVERARRATLIKAINKRPLPTIYDGNVRVTDPVAQRDLMRPKRAREHRVRVGTTLERNRKDRLRIILVVRRVKGAVVFCRDIYGARIKAGFTVAGLYALGYRRVRPIAAGMIP